MLLSNEQLDGVGKTAWELEKIDFVVGKRSLMMKFSTRIATRNKDILLSL